MDKPLPIAIGRTCHRCAGTGTCYGDYGLRDWVCHVCGGSGQQPAERDECCGVPPADPEADNG